MLQKNISRDLATIQQIRLPDTVRNFSRVNLARLPTPLQEALRFSKSLSGPDIYIKRDDLTGLAGGGNKTRKLEFLIGQALEQDADCVITAGAPQSNHCRQTAAAAAQCGLECHLVFGGASESVIEGNYFLDQLLGAKFHWTVRQLRDKKMNEVAEALQAEGKKPFVIPVGGSNAVGAIGYVVAMFEIMEQLATTNLQIDHIVFATSSGGTQAGLVVGAYMAGFRGKITGISIDQGPDETCDYKYKAFVLDIANSAAQMLDVNHKFESQDIEINYHYLGKGYGVVGELEQEAIPLLARTEGILVGPVYTGRALGGLIDMIRIGSITNKQNVLFWHTGDDITLHAHVSDFT
jgi:L-cysteate sulfo-lyase